MNSTTFALIITTHFLGAINYMILLPFIPIEFDRFKFQPSTLGYIYSIFAFTNMTLSFIVVNFMETFGRKKILLSGVLGMITCMISLALTSYIQNGDFIVVVLLGIRSLQGVATCLIDTSVYAIITVSFPNDKMKYLGFSQSSKGAGSTTGPIIGTVMYTLVGFQGIYFIMTILFVILFVLLSTYVPKSVDINDRNAGDQAVLTAYDTNRNLSSNGSVRQKQISFLGLFNSRVYLLTAFSAGCCFFNFCYYEPVLTIELENFEFSNFVIGMIFSIAPISYFIMLLSLSIFAKETHSKHLVVVGMLISAIGVTLMGPSQIISYIITLVSSTGELIDKTRYLMVMGFGHFLMGSSSVLFLLPILPIIIEDGIARYPHHKYRVSDISSGVLNFSITFGSGAGIIYGSQVTQYTNFRTCSSSIAVLTLAYSLVYYFSCILWEPKYDSELIEESSQSTQDTKEMINQINPPKTSKINFASVDV